jgi:RNA polymerase primary sigma factor
MKLKHKISSNGQIVNYGNRDFYGKYLSEISKYKPLSIEEETELFRRKDDKAAIDKIMKHNLLFVVSVARYYSSSLNSPTITLEDLINEGNIGLFEAIKNFDNTKGYKFISYAVWYIKRNILNSVNNNIKTIRIPLNTRTEITKLKNKEAKLEQLYGRPVSTLEIFETMLIDGELKESDTLDKFDNILKMHNFEKSLSSKITNDSDTELSETIIGDSPSVLDEILKEEKKEFVLTLLNKIPSEDRIYIMEHFGFETNIPLSFKEIAEKYNKTPEYIRNHINKNLRWLKVTSRSKKSFFTIE